MNQFTRSLLSLGEDASLERYGGTTDAGGYHTADYHPAETVRVLLRPGDIDVPYIDTGGEHGSFDWWCIAATETDLGQNDRLTRQRGFGAGGFGAHQFGTGNLYEVSMERACPVTGASLYQLDEADARH